MKNLENFSKIQVISKFSVLRTTVLYISSHSLAEFFSLNYPPRIPLKVPADIHMKIPVVQEIFFENIWGGGGGVKMTPLDVYVDRRAWYFQGQYPVCKIK